MTDVQTRGDEVTIYGTRDPTGHQVGSWRTLPRRALVTVLEDIE